MGSMNAVHGFLQQTWPSVPFTPMSAGGNLCDLRSVTLFGTRGTFVCALAARRENVTFAERATVSTTMAVAAVKPTAKTLTFCRFLVSYRPLADEDSLQQLTRRRHSRRDLDGIPQFKLALVE